MKFALGQGIDTTDEKKLYGKKYILLAAAIVGSALVIAAVVYGATKRSGNAKASSEFAGNVEVKRDACKLFNLEDAKKILGNNATASPNNANAVSPKATVSTCSYSSGVKDPEELIALTVLVRVSNKIQARQAFELARAENAKDVKNLGDGAYFNPDMSQLNLLKNDTWVIVASTEGTTGKGTLEIPKKTAGIILKRI